MYAERSYALAIKAKTEYPGGMYLSIDDPKRSLRYITNNGEKLILIGGESHKTGQGINTMLHYEALYSFAEATFGIDEVPYRWSAQDLITLDKLPYIGHINERNPNIFVATGYRKWGMTTGTAAAHLLKDSILKVHSPYKELYAPSRFHANPDIKTFLSQNIDVAKHLIAGKIETALRKRKISKLVKDLSYMLTVNEQVLIRTKKENYISSIQLVHISAVKLNGIMVIVLGIALAMVLVFN